MSTTFQLDGGPASSGVQLYVEFPKCSRVQPGTSLWSASSDHSEAGPSGAEQDIGSETRNVPAGPSRQIESARGGCTKAQGQHGRTRGCRRRDEGEIPVEEGEDHARPIS